MTKILLAGDHFVLPDHIRRAIDEACPGNSFEYSELMLPWPLIPFGRIGEVDEASGSEDEMIRALPDVAICVTQMGPFTERVLAAGNALKLVCVTRGGPINVNLDAAKKRGIKVLPTPGRNAAATAEHTVALMLAALRRLPDRHASILSGEWRSDYYAFAEAGFEVEGSTVGLVGYGAVGSRVARILDGFGAHVLVYDPFAEIESEGSLEKVETLEALLSRSRIVSLHARLTEASRGMIGKGELAMMPQGSVLVNAARGGLLDYDALCDALESGRLFAAGLDVFDEEPLPAGSRLRSAPNLVMTPHLAGATKETAHRAARIAADQVRRFMAGELS
ncbi:MAG TPA: 2-hydroxyacid dehydrogenase [Pararhizobium sp.]|nr:2-hydroxyacid dehydrogenase [Pararhizobium sp.]